MAEALHYKNLIESPTDLKERWRSLNSVVGSKQDFGSPLQVQDGKRLLLEPKEVATKFNRFFATIGTKIAGHLPPVDTDAWKKYELERKCDDREPRDFQQVGYKIVEEILLSLKISKAACLDKIPARLLRDAGKELTPSITFLLNKSLNDETVPALRKVAYVTPLQKTDDKLLVENYRPISVLPALSKVIERVVHQLSIHLDQLGYLYKHQYGFRRGHSTQQTIAQLNDWVLEAMNGGKVTGLLFVDISKAFNSLNHKNLLTKLESLGLSSRSLRWFRLCLADRRQRVLVNCLIVTLSHTESHRGAFWALCYSTFMLTACQMQLKTLG